MIAKKTFITVLIFLILMLGLSSCGGGGDGDDNTPTGNSTTWNELVWDDGTDDSTRKWAD